MTWTGADPAGMRVAATALRLRADRLSGIAMRVDNTAAAMPFTGPAADGFGSGVAAHSAEARAVCARMLATADTLTRQAAVLEAEQARLAREADPRP